MTYDRVIIMSDFQLQVPVEFSGKIMLVHGDGEVAEITYGFPMGVIPTKKEVEKAIAEALEQAKEAMPERNFRLPSKREYFDYIMVEKTGTSQRFAMPGSETWDE